MISRSCQNLVGFLKIIKIPKFSIALPVFLVILLDLTEGRRCYVCSTAIESDQLDCLYNVQKVSGIWNNISIIYCQNYCTIRRQEYSDFPGGINYFNRSCEDDEVDEVIVSGYFVTYVRSCRRDLCNFGDGLESLRHISPDEDVWPDVVVDFDQSNYEVSKANKLRPIF